MISAAERQRLEQFFDSPRRRRVASLCGASVLVLDEFAEAAVVASPNGAMRLIG